MVFIIAQVFKETIQVFETLDKVVRNCLAILALGNVDGLIEIEFSYENLLEKARKLTVKIVSSVPEQLKLYKK